MEAYFRVAIIYVVLSMAFFIQMDVIFLNRQISIEYFELRVKEEISFFLCVCVSKDNKPPLYQRPFLLKDSVLSSDFDSPYFLK